ncbi:MAG: hypothetical protein KatS3mg023_3875 [Armatimonadota bacterium]|nr:MAG: hypothetical protein KatS3mg023_3875 [Armatimonadota bacterium]
MLDKALPLVKYGAAPLIGGTLAYMATSKGVDYARRSDPESALARRYEDDPMGARYGMLTFGGMGASFLAYHTIRAGNLLTGLKNAGWSLGTKAFNAGRAVSEIGYDFGRGIYGAIFRDTQGKVMGLGRVFTEPGEYVHRVRGLVLGAVFAKMGIDMLTHENRMARAYAKTVDWRAARQPADFSLGVDGDIVLASYYNARSVWETAVT